MTLCLFSSIYVISVSVVSRELSSVRAVRAMVAEEICDLLPISQSD